MNKLSHFLKISIVDPFISSLKRYPETIIVGMISAILSAISLELDSLILEQIVRSLWLFIPYSLLTIFIIDRFKLSRKWRYIMLSISLLIILAYYFLGSLEPSAFADELRYLALFAGPLIVAFCLPYFPKKEGFSIYIIYLVSKAFATVFYALVLYGSISLVIATMQGLFSIHFSSYIYFHVLSLVVGFVAIPIFLGFIPLQDQQLTINDYHKIWKTVFSFIILPIIMVFTIILFLYILTSTFNSNYFPDIYLITTIGVGFLGLITSIALKPFLLEAVHIRFYDQYWPKAMLAVVAGYFVELIRLLTKSGFNTANMLYFYLGITLLFLLIVKSINKNIFKTNYAQTFLLAIVNVILLVGLYPFINIISVAKYQYNAQFKQLLVANNMLVDGQIVPRSDLNETERNKFFIIIDQASEVGFPRIAYLPDDFSLEDFEDVFGFEYKWYNSDLAGQYVNWSLEDSVIDLGQLPTYDYLFDIELIPESDTDYGTIAFTVSETEHTLIHDQFEITFKFYDIATYLYNSLDRYVGQFDIDQLTYSATQDNIDYTIYLRHLSGRLDIEEEVFEYGLSRFIIGVTVN